MRRDVDRGRRRSIFVLGAAALAAPLPVCGQQKFLRIGYLANDPDRASPTFQAFVGAMRELGWVEDTNLEILCGLIERGSRRVVPRHRGGMRCGQTWT